MCGVQGSIQWKSGKGFRVPCLISRTVGDICVSSMDGLVMDRKSIDLFRYTIETHKYNCSLCKADLGF